MGSEQISLRDFVEVMLAGEPQLTIEKTLKKLEKANVRVVPDLLRVQPSELAKRKIVPEARADIWIALAWLVPLRRMTLERARVLHDIGICTLRDLADQGYWSVWRKLSRKDWHFWLRPLWTLAILREARGVLRLQPLRDTVEYLAREPADVGRIWAERAGALGLKPSIVPFEWGRPGVPVRRGPRSGIRLRVVVVGSLILLAWAVVFGSGMLVATLPYRQTISVLASASDVAATAEGILSDARRVEQAGGQAADSITQDTLRSIAARIRSGLGTRADVPSWRAWLIVLFCYTPTNILLLSVLAGILGSLACRANLDWAETRDAGAGTQGDLKSPRLVCDEINPYFSGALRGAFVFLMLLSGLVLLMEDPFLNLDTSRYMRLAGFTSLVSFLVSLRGDVFSILLLRAIGRTTAEPPQTETAGGAPPEDRRDAGQPEKRKESPGDSKQ